MIISKKARELYDIDSSIINYEDLIAIFTDYYSAKVLAEKVNKIRENRDILTPENYVRASVINALGVLDEIYIQIIQSYYKDNDTRIRQELETFLLAKLGEKNYYSTLRSFVQVYPNNRLYAEEETFEEFIEGKTDGVKNTELLLDKILIAHLTNSNNAISMNTYGDFLDDSEVNQNSYYGDLILNIHEFFKEAPSFPKDSDSSLIEFLEQPLNGKLFLEDQLKFINTSWTKFLNKNQITHILRAISYILEENDMIWKMFHPGGSFTPILTYDFGAQEAFSTDEHWMPNVIMIAKSTYVWLDQLSKRYHRHIYRLDQIPEEELITFKNRGINAIWLIGLWERSKGSRRLKNIMGNPEAEASAYSLYDYVISNDLGGQQAYENLRNRAQARGIRLASDMVPNHMGIDSKLLFEKPHYFISLDHIPYPSYTFNSHNLSENPNIGIFIEDHYYNHSDASVVFKYVNFKTGETRYIYHGNDGTSMPWNDTAQLDFLKQEVREHVIQTIIHVARMFPIIRFDAAMTLAKAQFQRLWYPEPGTPGGVPSRSSYTVSQAKFNEFFPNEFWREVVDRIAQEVPDTLLLAEAFWMLEGYFVRTLGMHRVYNSAFMNMLKSELNDQYRVTIKNTLEFDPEILKRFVNFMNNPDEQTAVAQFGKGDKYFGVLLMMITMPGLPMIGHGQIEGFSEKYGMEFKRAYWNENEDHDLINRHELEIFPLLHQRWLFSDVVNFRLYDFYTHNGSVDENVFAYTNRVDNKKVLIIYHNKYASTSGWIKTSAAYLDRWQNDRQMKQTQLADSLQLTNKSETFVIFKDLKGKLEFIRKSTEVFERGLNLILGAYQYHIFIDFYEVEDTEKIYSKVHDFLNGSGTHSISDAIIDLELHDIQQNAKKLFDKSVYLELHGSKNFERFSSLYRSFLRDVSLKKSIAFNYEEIEKELTAYLSLTFSIEKLDQTINSLRVKEKFSSLNFEILFSEIYEREVIFYVLYCVLFIGKGSEIDNYHEKSLNFLDQLRLKKIILSFFNQFQFSPEKSENSYNLVQILLRYHALPEDTYPSNFLLYIAFDMFNDPLISKFLSINYFENEFWFNKEKFESLTLFLIYNIILYNKPDLTEILIPKMFKLIDISIISEFKINALRKSLKNFENSNIIKPKRLE